MGAAVANLFLARIADALFYVVSGGWVNQRCKIKEKFCALNFAENFYQRLIGTLFRVVADNPIF